MNARLARSVLCSALALASSGACSGKQNASPAKAASNAAPAEPTTQKQEERPLVRVLPPGRDPVAVNVEVARTEEQRQQGLMHRKKLDENAGMFFIFERPEHLTFWMRNTYVSLDMIFIDDQLRVVGVVENATPLTDDKREVPGKSQFVLEVNAGFARRFGVGAGTAIEVEHIELPPKSAAAAEENDVAREPTTPDPMKGRFGLADATKNLPKGRNLVAEIVTSLGTIRCVLDDKHAPATVANFVGLARGMRPFWDGRKRSWDKRPYYDGTSFHRVIPEFMIQGGDYLGDGTGEVGFTVPDELDPSLRHDRAGQLCMANRGPDTNGAQFFITDAAAPHLDGSYTIFGSCGPTSVVSAIARVPQEGPPNNRPLSPVTITKVTIQRTNAPSGN